MQQLKSAVVPTQVRHGNHTARHDAALREWTDFYAYTVYAMR